MTYGNEGKHFDIAIWTDELTSSVLKKYEEIYHHKDRHPNFSKNMWKIIVDHINGNSTEWFFYRKTSEVQDWYNEEEI